MHRKRGGSPADRAIPSRAVQGVSPPSGPHCTTVIDAVPLIPPLLAEIVALPAEVPGDVTPLLHSHSPTPLTLLQVNEGWLVSAGPNWLYAVAEEIRGLVEIQRPPSPARPDMLESIWLTR